MVKVGSFGGGSVFRNLDARNSEAAVISREFIKVDKGYGSLSQYLQVFVLTVQDTSVLLYSTVVQGIVVLCFSLHHILLMCELAIYTVN